ncbi:MAG: 3-deoxy-manno-octulosonate cytidylyltransferase [Kiritimatiellaceae bacterium]|nr:3-deoxy-manno-octulosonate cytidylyltransferase [Kiritimatiellaceae bacterium]
MKIIGIIPTRWGSTRFPGKCIAPIAGKPMIQRVVERARQAKRLNSLIVATDDARIAEVVENLQLPDVQIVMTRSDHPTGTDRIAEAVDSIHADAYINIQGDEPFIAPALIDQLAYSLEDPQWQMATAITTITNESEINDPSVVKALFNDNGAALYFSRAAIPFLREAQTTFPENTYWRHIGIYGYRRDFLQQLVQTPPCLLEEAEKLEQLRALHIGGRIHMIQTNDFGISVDTPDDLIQAEKIIQERNLS